MKLFDRMREADQVMDRRLRSLKVLSPASVDEALHRRIMHRVESVDGRRSDYRRRLVPAIGATLAVVTVVVLMRPQDQKPSQLGLPLPEVRPTLQQALAPEAALEAEYEALKSDLRKLGLRV